MQSTAAMTRLFRFAGGLLAGPGCLACAGICVFHMLTDSLRCKGQRAGAVRWVLADARDLSQSKDGCG